MTFSLLHFSLFLFQQPPTARRRAACSGVCRLLWRGLLAGLIGAGALGASAAEPPTFLTGPAFRRGAAQQVKIAWRNAPLRDALGSLEAQTRLAIWLDRRIDPGQTIDFNAENEPIEQLLPRLAKPIGAAAIVLDSVFYVGPAETAAALPGVLQERKRELRRLPAEVQRKFAIKTASQWPDLTSPRELLDALQAKRRIRINNAKDVPHDLWAGRSLPPLGLVDQLQLILAGFNATFRFADDGKQIIITPSRKLGADEPAAKK